MIKAIYQISFTSADESTYYVISNHPQQKHGRHQVRAS